MKLAKSNKILFIFSVFMLFVTAAFYYGCGSDTTTTPAVSDDNVVIYDSVDVFPASTTGVNLWDGKNTASTDTKKDMLIVDNGGSTYFFESGDLASSLVGAKTGFTLVDSNYTSSQFNSLSSVSSWGTTIDPAIFNKVDTRSWGLLTNPLTKYPVYGFYLEGKFADGTTANKVYGVFRVNNIISSGPLSVRVNISIKLNKTGANKFTK